MLDWYHLYLNHPGGVRILKTILVVFYWKGLVTQVELYSKPFKICHQFKNRNNIYGNLPSNNIAEVKPWDSVHVELIGPYSKSII